MEPAVFVALGGVELIGTPTGEDEVQPAVTITAAKRVAEVNDFIIFELTRCCTVIPL